MVRVLLLLVKLGLHLPRCIIPPHVFQQKVLHHRVGTSRVRIDRAPTLVDNVDFLNASPVNEVLDNERRTTTCLGSIKLDESLNQQTMLFTGSALSV